MRKIKIGETMFLSHSPSETEALVIEGLRKGEKVIVEAREIPTFSCPRCGFPVFIEDSVGGDCAPCACGVSCVIP